MFLSRESIPGQSVEDLQKGHLVPKLPDSSVTPEDRAASSSSSTVLEFSSGYKVR